jgi:hypothetical protein
MATPPTTSGSGGGAEPKPADTKAAPAPAPAETPEQKAAREAAQAAGSIGAQVILDFNGAGSLGARGGAATTIEENSAAYAAHMVELGLDPAAPSGPPPTPEVRKAREAAGEAMIKAQADVQAAHATSGSGTATRVSSLAAGILTEPGDIPPPSGGSVRGASAH